MLETTETTNKFNLALPGPDDTDDKFFDCASEISDLDGEPEEFFDCDDSDSVDEIGALENETTDADWSSFMLVAGGSAAIAAMYAAYLCLSSPGAITSALAIRGAEGASVVAATAMSFVLSRGDVIQAAVCAALFSPLASKIVSAEVLSVLENTHNETQVEYVEMDADVDTLIDIPVEAVDSVAPVVATSSTSDDVEAVSSEKGDAPQSFNWRVLIVPGGLAAWMPFSFGIRWVQKILAERRELKKQLEQHRLYTPKINENNKKNIEALIEFLEKELKPFDISLDALLDDKYMCPISHDIMSDPVSTKYGIRYSWQSLKAMIKNNGSFIDPLTSQPDSKSSIRPDLALQNEILEDLQVIKANLSLIISLKKKGIDLSPKMMSALSLSTEVLLEIADSRKNTPVEVVLPDSGVSSIPTPSEMIRLRIAEKGQAALLRAAAPDSPLYQGSAVRQAEETVVSMPS